MGLIQQHLSELLWLQSKEEKIEERGAKLSANIIWCTSTSLQIKYLMSARAATFKSSNLKIEGNMKSLT